MSAREPRLHRVAGFALDSGRVLDEVVQAYHLDGELNRERDNLVVVFHALTGSADAAEGWWREVVGPGLTLDTGRYAVLCANLLGSCYGTVGPWQRTGEPPPPITPRDQARLIGLLVEELGVRSVALATGGSLGGMVALEWAALFPERTRAVVVLAAPAAHTAQAIGWNHVQRRAIEIAGVEGLALARMAAMLTYRTADEFEARFGREEDGEGRFQVQRYLEHHGERLLARFDVPSYLALTGAMDAHDVGRGRGGVRAALAPFRGKLVGVGIPGDLLYTDADVRRWTDETGAEYREIRSVHGHDAFLIESGQVSTILSGVLNEVSPARAGEEKGTG
ncbi:MAG: homoserine O-acetyltransferase [Gemmatimonadetes bacterium]|nr:homoserine O-acetyltransferase [Gemmatimonadota bacterium]